MRSRYRDVSAFIENGHTVHKTEQEMVDSPLSTGLTSVRSNGQWFDYVFQDHGADTTLITFSAAIPNSELVYPRFSGLPVAKAVDTNILAFSDPAHGGTRSVPTSWHLGTKWVDSQLLIPKVIEKVQLHNNGTHLLFFGSSAGGFAALNYSSLFPGSAALVMNPRVNLLAAPIKHARYVNASFPGQDPDEFISNLHFDQAKIYASNIDNFVVYLQNQQDETYYTSHFRHFHHHTQDNPNIKFVLGDWGEGHVIPPRPLFMQLVQDLVRSSPNWQL